jgi:hypothetical protein
VRPLGRTQAHDIRTTKQQGDEMIVRSGDKFLVLSGEMGATMRVRESNRGEPYRGGVELEVDDPDGRDARVFLERGEVIALRDLLNRLYP